MTDVYIVRHGNTFDPGDTVTRVGARTDLPLSSSGLGQADALADYFAITIPTGFSRATCSPLLRTRQTAETILNASSNAPELETLEFLREVDYGPDENQPEDKVIARIGEKALMKWEEAAIPPVGWEIDPDQVRAAWRELFDAISCANLDRPVLIVTSNGIARFALAHPETPLGDGESIKLRTAAFGCFEIKPDGSVHILQWNQRAP